MKDITTVFDVAHYVLSKCGSMSAMKLQKLVYYAQAWHLAWEDVPLFEEKIEAWANGPVVRELYNQHRGQFILKPPTFSELAKNKLSDAQKETIDKVCEHYNPKSPQWLSHQTHSEAPWQNAREGVAELERGEQEITQESMCNYYSSL